MAPSRTELSGIGETSAARHRWHAPVSGIVSRAYAVDSTYYSDADSEGEDPGGLNDSQGYITAAAARAVIVIECDDHSIGKVGCEFVGMADVSSCMIEALPGQHVKKGDELGFFRYGGSTCCLVFEPDVLLALCRSPRLTMTENRRKSTRALR